MTIGVGGVNDEFYDEDKKYFTFSSLIDKKAFTNFTWAIRE
jgi:hypothetical protein